MDLKNDKINNTISSGSLNVQKSIKVEDTTRSTPEPVITLDGKKQKQKGEKRKQNLLFALDVEPRVTHQSDLVEDSAVDAQIVSLVHSLVASMEHLALSFHISVESRLGLGSAREGSLGHTVVGGIAGVLGAEEGEHFSGSQSRLEEVPYKLALGLVVSLAGGESDEGAENEKLHGCCGVLGCIGR